MKTLINAGLFGLIALYVFDQPTYMRIEAPFVHVIHYLLVIYVVWILFADFFKSLKKRLSERFGFTLKKWKRKVNKLRHN